MSAEQSSQTRSEQPTPKKLQDSRKKGQVARSRELNTTVMMLASAIGLLLLGGQMGQSLQALLAADLSINRDGVISNELLLTRLGDTATDSLFILLPFFGIMMMSVFVGPLLLGGWSFSTSAWQPKFNRLSPLAGIKRMFGMQGFVEMLKALGKFIVIGVVALIALHHYEGQILSLGAMPVMDAVAAGIAIIGQLFLLLASSLLLVSMIDVPYQLVSHMNRLKMSIQEIRDEQKQTNGNPELKGRIRSMQREVSQRRMLQAVADADVVIVNPTHFSVALKYDHAGTGAPMVVAKGVDFMAMRIREIANGNAVAVFSAPPLARALYRHTDVGQEVPSALYHAVAQVLAYVYQVRDATTTERANLHRPTSIEIPTEFTQPDEAENREPRA